MRGKVSLGAVTACALLVLTAGPVGVAGENGKQLVSVLFSTKNRTDTNYPDTNYPPEKFVAES